MATVELRDVRKSYGGTGVIHGIDMQVADGEFVVIAMQKLFVRGLVETEK